MWGYSNPSADKENIGVSIGRNQEGAMSPAKRKEVSDLKQTLKLVETLSKLAHDASSESVKKVILAAASEIADVVLDEHAEFAKAA
jgi:hypothetical protein